MKCIIGLILLVASTLAIDSSNLKQSTLNRQAIDSKNTRNEWDNLKINPKFKATLDNDELKHKTELPRNQTRIFGGETAYYGQFPWQAAIGHYGYIYCGGVLISDEWLLTTAACVNGLDEFVVVIGAIHLSGIEDIDKKEISVYSGNVTMHPGFNKINLDYNIALIRLPYRVEFNEHVRPPRLLKSCMGYNIEGVPFVFSGWGSVSGSYQDRSSVLLFATLMGASKDDCAAYNDFSVEVCMEVTSGMSPCYGDFGGPLVSTSDDPFLVGLLTRTPIEGCYVGKHAGFVHFSMYLQWIQDTTGIPLVC